MKSSLGFDRLRPSALVAAGAILALAGTLACARRVPRAVLATSSAESSTRAGHAVHPRLRPAPPPRTARERTEAERALGIEVLAVRRAGAGYIIDFRFTVREPDKAKPLLARNAAPLIVHEKSHRAFKVPTTPKVGSLRQKTPAPEKDRAYFVFFANPGKYMKAGDRVAVVFEGRRIDNLVIE